MSTTPTIAAHEIYCFGGYRWRLAELAAHSETAQTVMIDAAGWAAALGPDPATTPNPTSVGLFGVDWFAVDELDRRAAADPSALAAILAQPVLLVTLPQGIGSELLVEGWDRVALATRHGIDTLPGLLFDRATSQGALHRHSRTYTD